jgi:hypothetical protein
MILKTQLFCSSLASGEDREVHQEGVCVCMTGPLLKFACTTKECFGHDFSGFQYHLHFAPANYAFNSGHKQMVDILCQSS